MRFALGFFTSSLIGLSMASTDASVYIFQGDQSKPRSSTPTLSPEQAQLIFAQRLGLSNNFKLADASELTLSYINKFGRTEPLLFKDSDKSIAELVLIVEGISSNTVKPLFKAWPSSKPDFYLSRTHGIISPNLLGAGFQSLNEEDSNGHTLKTLLNPLSKTHWPKNSKVIHLDIRDKTDGLNQLIDAQAKLQNLVEQRKMNALVILIPEIIRPFEAKPNLSEEYEKFLAIKRVAEEPIISSSLTPSLPLKQAKNSVQSNRTFKGVPQLCHKSLDACISSTKNCSGHGECLSKYKDHDSKGACFSCSCRASNESITWAKGARKGWTISYWGGSACHKQDISSAFWLVSTFSIVTIGVISWGVGMLFSIGEEKLPGVIGAGVSSSKSRAS